MLAGGCKTRVFLVKIGGFDTHAEQVESYDTTMGAHAALLYHVSSAMKAFQDDLRARGLEDQVLTVTTSEFGRRIDSNGSYGTDHGTGAPVMIFGKGANPGVVGEVPDLNERNVSMQYDYRQIYANIMRDWMGVSDQALNEIFPGIMTAEGTSDGVVFTELPLAQRTITDAEGFISSRFALRDCFPNPAVTDTNIHFMVNNSGTVVVSLLDINGNEVKRVVDGHYIPGEYKINVNVSGIKPGSYICLLKAGIFRQSKKLTIIG